MSERVTKIMKHQDKRAHNVRIQHEYTANVHNCAIVNLCNSSQ